MGSTVKKSMLMRSCAFLAMPMLGVVAVPTAAVAQQITTSIAGQVANDSGAPISGATVVITDNRTGATRNTTTGADGRFSADNLTTGGPYSITATAEGFQGQTVEGVNTTLQGTTTLGFNLAAAGGEVGADTIVVTAARANISTLSTGPGTSFSEAVMETAPTFQRDVRDVIRLDPRVSLTRDDLSDQDRVSCLGGNDRGNAFTVDGILQNDIYGLNETGFSARTSTPIPYDAIRETQVNFAPFDVEYGQFTGCAINVVTRGGTNTFHGGGWFEVTGDDFNGTKAGDVTFKNEPDYRDKRWGVNLGGPIVKDKLFLFGAYEQSKSASTVESGPAGAGYPIELANVTAADFATFSNILSNTYGVNTIGLPSSLPFSNKRYFLRADAQLSDSTHFYATYQRIKEKAVFTDDYNTSNSTNPVITGLDNAYAKGSDGTFYSAGLLSQLTSNLSAELKYSRTKTVDVQDPLGGGEAQSDAPQTRFVVGVFNPTTGGYGALIAGPGFSRAANDLRSWINQYKATAKLDLGAHKLKGGIELNQAHLYNLFVQNATGTLQFRNLTDFANGVTANGTNTGSANGNTLYTGGANGAYGNFTASGDINDAAADFRRNLVSMYVQDDWHATDALDITAGLRVDMFSGDAPLNNSKYYDRYGIRNDVGFDQVPAVYMPRISATYRLGDFAIFGAPKVRAGFGVFSGGDPLVWFGNAFQNSGSRFGFASKSTSNCGAAALDVVDASGNFTGFPTCVVNAAAASARSGDAKVNSVDPDIKMPTVNRFNVGFESRLNFGPEVLNNWRFNADFIYSKYKNPFTMVDLAQAPDARLGLNGATIDGRPIYRGIDLLRAGCNATLVSHDPTPVYENLTAACFTTSRDDELMLTNADGYRGWIASFLLSKNFNRGVFTSGGNVFVNLGYAYSDVQDRRNMYNSTAGSNYDTTAAFDRQNPDASNGFYMTRHNISLSTTFKERFFGDNDTTFGMSFIARSGRPYSLTFTGGGDFNVTNSGFENALAYIPTGVNDPNLSPSSNPTAVASYVDFINKIGCAKDYRGKSIARNTCFNDWYYDMDLRLAQEIPGPMGMFSGRNDKIEVYAMMDNFLNFLNHNWNVFRRREFAGRQDVVDLANPGVDSQGRYIISAFDPNAYDVDNQVKLSSSLWRVKVGVKYNF